MAAGAYTLDIDSTDIRNATVTERKATNVLYTVVSDGNTEHVSFYRGEAASAGAQPFAVLDRHRIRSDKLTYQSHHKASLDQCLQIKKGSAHFEEEGKKYTFKAGAEYALVLTSDSTGSVVATFYPPHASKDAPRDVIKPHVVLEGEARGIQGSVFLYGFLVLLKEKYDAEMVLSNGKSSWSLGTSLAYGVQGLNLTI